MKACRDSSAGATERDTSEIVQEDETRPHEASVDTNARAAIILSRGAEAGDGGGIAVEDVEYGHQLRDLQNFLELGAEVGELERGALRARAMERGDQRSEPGAVDVSDVRQIQHDLFLSRRHQRLDSLAESVALLAENDPAVDIEHGNAIHIVIRYSQCHVLPPDNRRF